MKVRIQILMLLIAGAMSAQQDPQYNMYQYNQMLINPAYAGSRDAISVVASTRQQWTGTDGAPRTTALSVHSPIARKNIGVGLTVYNDLIGPRNLIGIYGNFSYIMKVSESSKLSFGLSAGYNRYQFAFTKITFKDGEVPPQFFQNQSSGTVDINAGAYYKMPGFFAGVSVAHLNNPKVYSYEAVSPGANGYVYKSDIHLYYMIGKSFILSPKFILAPTIMVKHTGNVISADINVNAFLMRKLWFGVFYRSAFGPGALIQYYITDNLRVGYSYDTGLNDARKLGGSHEVMFGYDFSSSSPRKISHPRFL